MKNTGGFGSWAQEAEPTSCRPLLRHGLRIQLGCPVLSDSVILSADHLILIDCYWLPKKRGDPSSFDPGIWVAVILVMQLVISNRQGYCNGMVILVEGQTISVSYRATSCRSNCSGINKRTGCNMVVVERLICPVRRLNVLE